MFKLQSFLAQLKPFILVILLTVIGWMSVVLLLNMLAYVLDFINTQYPAFFLLFAPNLLNMLIFLFPFMLFFSAWLGLTSLLQKRLLTSLLLNKAENRETEWYGPRLTDFIFASIPATIILVAAIYPTHVGDNLLIIAYAGLVFGFAQGCVLLRNFRKANFKPARSWTVLTWLGILIGVDIGYRLSATLYTHNSSLQIGSTALLIGIGICAAIVGLTAGLVARAMWMNMDAENVTAATIIDPVKKSQIRWNRFKIWGLWTLITTLGWMTGILIANPFETEQLPLVISLSILQGLLIGGMTGLALRLVLRYHARDASKWSGALPTNTMLGVTVGLFILMGITIWQSTSSGDRLFLADHPFLCVAGVAAVAQWIILRPGLPGKGSGWGVLWGMIVWITSIIGAEIIPGVFFGLTHTSVFSGMGYWPISTYVIGNILSGLAVGAVTGGILLKLFEAAAARSSTDLTALTPAPAIPSWTWLQGCLVGPMLAALAWLIPGFALVSVVAAIYPKILEEYQRFGLDRYTIDVPSSLIGTFLAGGVFSLFLGGVFGPALLNDLYQWAANHAQQRFARKIPLIGKSMSIIVFGLLLTLALSMIAICYNLIKPIFRWMGPMLEISAPCPELMQQNCLWYPDWPYYDVWLTTYQSKEDWITINPKAYCIFRMKLENKNDIDIGPCRWVDFQ